ncbi:MAG: right-handed parallel beta-helix repeat-containing protein, partial [Oscillospiraceae bacterium]|nr:right-handed parallel beta-helix repeat-containing protein [Oscillospiraceae bacterium]
MKRTHICALLLTLAMLASLAGCSGASGKAGPAAEAPAQESAAPASAAAEPATAAEPEPATEAEPDNETIRVATVGEFLNAIAPGAVIELAPGVYNLTEYLNGVSVSVSDYVGRSFCSDGWQAEIIRVDGLTIRGADGGVEVVAEPRHADVLFFNACSDITIENITFGHTVEKGNCSGAVLEYDRCRDVTLNGLDLYGCGTYGVSADHTTGITLSDSTIRDCSYGIVSLMTCAGVTAKDCTFKNNNGYDLINLLNSFALFDGCTFVGNEGDELLHASAWYGDDSGARLRDIASAFPGFLRNDGSALHLKFRRAAPAGDADLPHAPGDAHLLAAGGAAEVGVLAVGAEGPLPPEPVLQGAQQSQEPGVLHLPPLRVFGEDPEEQVDQGHQRRDPQRREKPPQPRQDQKDQQPEEAVKVRPRM